MGALRGLYNPEFPKGTKVKIASRGALEEFAKTWRYHHPLHEDQLEFHDVEAVVDDVYFYHGGDELYKLSQVPGLWHEQCLKDVSRE
jgi:diadenosine tetraphosphatase ApaH/serine/threonine PP2A family protein phosphatase